MVGDVIRKLRQERGLSQFELGKICGMNQVMLSAFESGERKPNLDQLETIANCFGVDMAYFLRKKQDIVMMTEDELRECVNDNPQLIFLLRKAHPFSSEKMDVLLNVANALAQHGDGKIDCVVIREEE